MKIIESGRKCNNCSRKNCFINKCCSEEWKSFLTEHKTTYLFERGEKIFAKGQQAKGVYTVFSGYIKISDIDDKSERIVDLVTRGHILGHRALGESVNVYSVTAESLSESEITFFSADIFRLAIESNKKLAHFIIDLLTKKLRSVEIRYRNFQKMHAKEKIICSLNDIIETFGTEEQDETRLKFSLARKDIAGLAVTTYETVIRILGDLDKSNYIKIDGKEIKILDRNYFAENAKRLLN
jgi:CRP-like cAMP-binding protein